MRRIRVPGFTAFASALALVVAAIPFSGLTSGPVAQGQTTTVQAASPGGLSAGTLKLSTTSSVGTVEWDGRQQQFREASQCRIVQDEDSPYLLRLEGIVGNTTGTAGFRNGNIGVYEFDSEGDGATNAAQCFRVDSGSFAETETLGLRLGAEVLEATLPLVASQATVSLVRTSKTGTILVELLDADENVVATEKIGWQGGKPGSEIPTGALMVDEGVFAEVRLTAEVGSFSLRGATFDLVYSGGVLDCLDEPVVLEGDGTDPAVTLTRLNNADSAEDCELIPYTLSNDDQEVSFLKPLDEQISAQFILDIVWTVSPANTDWTSTDALLPETTIDYGQGGGEIPLRWCPDVTTGEGGEPTGIADVLTNPAVIDQDELLGTQFTCLVSQNASVVDGDPDDSVTVQQKIYLLGDIVFRFR
ncbi:MAG: hypothetical protein ABR616_00175 [Dermatophilaceae bacterium]|nr:hypothetical protein [Intrasporangiaceae bacterium]